MPMLFEQCIKTDNKRLREEAKIAMLLTVVKLLFKFCSEKKKEEVKESVEKVKEIFEWYADEMAESLEIYELLNFYYGIVKNFDSFNYEALVKLINAGFMEELLPVHPQVRVRN